MRRFPGHPRAAARGALIGAAFALVVSAACSSLLTEAPADGEVFDAPLDGLTSVELAAFVRGDEEFARRFSPATGLGPVFNNVSCASCHGGDGRGRLEHSLQRFGTEADGFLAHLGGPQVQDRAVPGAEPERAPAGVAISLRLPAPVFGAGLIEAIPESVLLALADQDDRNSDGISGRVNWVSHAPYVPASEPNGSAGPRIGRFGRKAQTVTILQQTVEAYHQDMGITSEFRPSENRNPLAAVATEAADHASDPEVPTATVLAVVHYLRALAPPAPGEMTAQRRDGDALFRSAGCAACHTPTLRTGAHPLRALADRDVPLYSDLLLHDMGDALADQRPDGSATGREWRTTPLWGLRLMRQFLNGQAFLMHDGRARSVDEAIRLHGGEGQRARDAYVALSPAQRAALLDFVESR
ncbi:MAG: thiol oxidoreductase [Gemmatimonadetes bacterium]|nr:thiol oxidoreductase [Gemmatimonadota bacterium]